MKVDFLFLVEHEDRELSVVKEICKLLRNKGFSSVVLSAEFHCHLFRCYKPQCVVFPYATDSDNWLVKFFSAKKDSPAFVTLNWEQLLSNANKAFKRPRGELIQKHFYHLAWSDDFKSFLVESGVAKENVEVLGNPAVELLYRACQNNEYWNGKLRDSYYIAKDKKIVFLPMNYGWAFFSDGKIKAKIEMGYDKNVAWEYRDYSQKCLKAFVGFIHEVSKNTSLHLVIRPHPSISIEQYFEIFDNQGHDIRKVNNITLTKEYTIKEWIAASDVVGSSWSTSVWDAVCIGKNGFLYTPYDRPKWLETSWNNKVPNIDKAEDVEQVMSASLEPEVAPDTIIGFISEWLVDISLKGVHAELKSKNEARLIGYLVRSRLRDISMKYLGGYKIQKGLQRDYFEPIEYLS
ncbi:MAG: hypothetical protein D6B27_07755 [Gammaproteobacteria bacterium]|nr:MAG: hypothetical protein D6B27_07755 [Gammaproteobacteria bacterium]